MTSLEIMSKMVNRFHEAVPEEYKDRCPDLGLTLTEAVTIASMIQKEAVTAREKPVIASVFLNRLKRNMPMQSDPTAVYGIEGFRRKILPKTSRETPLQYIQESRATSRTHMQPGQGVHQGRTVACQYQLPLFRVQGRRDPLFLKNLRGALPRGTTPEKLIRTVTCPFP
jgi:UPF0755 protein